MPNPYFKFKQFTVYHDKCAMKVGTDGVLLGAWCDVAGARRVLDVGTGTGLIALMIAQRSEARITALDVDAAAVEQARENCSASPWAERIDVEQADFCSYRPDALFDCIVSNPPYFVEDVHCPDKQRNMARHTAGLTFSSLLERVGALFPMRDVFLSCYRLWLLQILYIRQCGINCIFPDVHRCVPNWEYSLKEPFWSFQESKKRVRSRF